METVAPLIKFTPVLAMQWVTVIVLFLILKKFFYEKVYAFIQARETAVKDVFDNAEGTNRKADEKLEAYNKKLAGIENEGREIIKSAKVKADEQAKQIIDEAHKKAELLMQQTQSEIDREKRKALAEMKNQIGVLALLAAEKIMEKELETTGQDAYIDQIIEQAGASGWQN